MSAKLLNILFLGSGVSGQGVAILTLSPTARVLLDKNGVIGIFEPLLTVLWRPAKPWHMARK